MTSQWLTHRLLITTIQLVITFMWSAISSLYRSVDVVWQCFFQNVKGLWICRECATETIAQMISLFCTLLRNEFPFLLFLFRMCGSMQTYWTKAFTWTSIEMVAVTLHHCYVWLNENTRLFVNSLSLICKMMMMKKMMMMMTTMICSMDWKPSQVCCLVLA